MESNLKNKFGFRIVCILYWMGREYKDKVLLKMIFNFLFLVIGLRENRGLYVEKGIL